MLLFGVAETSMNSGSGAFEVMRASASHSASFLMLLAAQIAMTRAVRTTQHVKMIKIIWRPMQAEQA